MRNYLLVCIYCFYYNLCIGGASGMPSPVQLENVNVNIPGVGQTLSAERYITCKNLICFLSPGEPESIDFCYDWTVREINTPHIEANCNIVQGYTIEAC